MSGIYHDEPIQGRGSGRRDRSSDRDRRSRALGYRGNSSSWTFISEEELYGRRGTREGTVNAGSLPEKLRNPAANEYVQGVEVEPDYAGEIPEGFEVIDLPASTYLLFRGEPFAEEDYVAAIGEIWDAEKKYDPAFIGFEWDNENPRIQLEPRGERGYIELVPVKKRG